MGKPAARLGDMTAHGGAIVVGFPTVLIGGMPAARLGDMHVCPMFTGYVPHVGGPVAVGSAGVLIGNMPAARMGDLCVCVGPPDSIVAGCPTVLIGETCAGGGGGGAGAGAGGGGGGNVAVLKAVLTSAQLANIVASGEVTEEEAHSLDVLIIDKANLPIAGPDYELTSP
jgi:uncharacterized Zn-binding protein involved in type VI secretion